MRAEKLGGMQDRASQVYCCVCVCVCTLAATAYLHKYPSGA